MRSMSVGLVLFIHGIFAQTTCPWNGLDCSVLGGIASYAGDTDPGYITSNGAYPWVYKYQTVLVQLAYIYSRPDEVDRPNPFRDLDLAYICIDRALEMDPTDYQAWYILGRYWMQRVDHSKAHEAYQQSVYRNSRNSKLWSSIGILYQARTLYRDALDAYTRAIRLNPYIPEIWFNLGTLYERAKNPLQDSLDAYRRAEKVDDTYTLAAERVKYLTSLLETGRLQADRPPAPQEIDPLKYADSVEEPDVLGSEDVCKDGVGEELRNSHDVAKG